MQLASLTVIGSTGNHYSITVDGESGRARCSCPAFYYSRGPAPICKHIEFAARALAGSPAEAPLLRLVK